MSENRSYYFNNTLRKINVAFMSMFTGLKVAKNDAAGNLISYRDVPVNFAHKGKFLSNIKKHAGATGAKDYFSLYLPRIAVVISGITPAREKTRGGHLVELHRYTDVNTNAIENIFGGVPYTIDYSVSILSQHMSEVSMIMEQILPTFTPYRNITIREFDFLPGFTRDVKVLLNSVSPEFQDESSEEDVHRVEIDMTFSMDCVFYRPILVSDIVKTVRVELLDNSVLENGNLLSSMTYQVSGNSEDSDIVITDHWTDPV